MIYPACPEGGMAHTVEMKGAPATRHEVPCDCDTVTAAAFVDEINAMKAELNEKWS